MRQTFLYIVVIILSAPYTARAQHLQLRTKYLHMADTATTDSMRIRAYAKLTEEYLDTSYSEAMRYAGLADSLADKYPAWTPGKILAQTAIGYVYQAIDLPDTALHYFHAARALALEVPNKTYLKKCTFALFRFHKGGNNDSALYYTNELLKYARQLRDTTLEMFAVNELGSFYFDRNLPLQAIGWFKQALPVLRFLRQYNREGIVLQNIGSAWLGLQQQDSARHYLFTARATAAQSPSLLEQATIELAIVDYFQKMRRPDSARVVAEKALRLGAGLEDKTLQRDIWQKLSVVYEQTGRPAQALTAQKQFILYRDSVAHEERNLDDTKKILRASYAQQLAIVNRAQHDLQGTSRLQRRLLLAAIVGLLLLSALAFVYYTALVRIRKRERTIAGQAALLREQTATIQVALSEKEVLMREIHHRVKNNLQVIFALQQMQASRSHDPAVKAALADSQNRVLSIAFIHHNLYQHDDLSGVEMQSFVQELAGHVLDVCSGDDRALRITQNIPPATLDIDTAVPAGLIINELLTNSCKHAFKDRHEGHIGIELRPDGNGHYLLIYEDDGPGLDPNTDFSKADSLGLKLIHQLTGQLDGTLQYTRDATSRFTIAFKDFETRNAD